MVRTTKSRALRPKSRETKREAIDGVKAPVEIVDEHQSSGNEILFRVSLRHVDSSDTNLRMRRALRMILRAAQGDETSV